MDLNQVKELMKINTHFQVTIPLAIRNAFKIDRGGYLEVSLTNEGVLLKPIKLENMIKNGEVSFKDMLVKDELKSAAGGWKYLVDAEKLKKDIQKSRSIQTERKYSSSQ